MSERLTFVHNPTGTDAPYFAGPDERVPRDPIGGDMVVHVPENGLISLNVPLDQAPCSRRSAYRERGYGGYRLSACAHISSSTCAQPNPVPQPR